MCRSLREACRMQNTETKDILQDPEGVAMHLISSFFAGHVNTACMRLLTVADVKRDSQCLAYGCASCRRQNTDCKFDGSCKSDLVPILIKRTLLSERIGTRSTLCLYSQFADGG